MPPDNETYPAFVAITANMREAAEALFAVKEEVANATEAFAKIAEFVSPQYYAGESYFQKQDEAFDLTIRNDAISHEAKMALMRLCLEPCGNRRVVWLTLHAKRYRARKKNHNRAMKLMRRQQREKKLPSI